MFNKLPFDAQKDFAPISLLGTFDIAVVVPENSRFKTLADLLAEAKAKPGKLNIATIAVGSTQNLAAELFKTTAGIDAQVVPFNGTPAVITALRGGQVDAAVEILARMKAQITSKALRALATFGEKRPDGLPTCRRHRKPAARSRACTSPRGTRWPHRRRRRKRHRRAPECRELQALATPT
jgi:tripartite-type tricarboxylate transporter receptor subunit TctC